MQVNSLCGTTRVTCRPRPKRFSRVLRVTVASRDAVKSVKRLSAKNQTASNRLQAATLEGFIQRPITFRLQPNKLRVAVDVDEVLGQFVVALNSFCKQRYGMLHNVDDYHVYHFATVWGCSQEISTKIVHEFFESPFFHRLPLVPGAFEALCEMQEWCDLHVVTSRQHVIKDITIQWLSNNFPGMFSSVHFGNHYAKNGKSKQKSEICREIKADVLIDDNPDYAFDCAASGMHVILYNWKKSYPWAYLGDRTKHNKIREVNCWSHIPLTLRQFQCQRKLM